VRAAARLDGSEQLAVRPHLELRLDGDRLRSRAGELTLEAAEIDRLGDLLAAGRTSASDLGVDLARRLLLGGVVVLADAGDDAVEKLSHP
jgi:hypothetical protein